MDERGDKLRGLTIVNVSIGEERYVEAIWRNKAKEIAETTKSYARDLEDEHPQEIWPLLHFSL